MADSNTNDCAKAREFAADLTEHGASGVFSKRSLSNLARCYLEREAMLDDIRTGLLTIRERELSGGNGIAVIDALLARLSTEGK